MSIATFADSTFFPTSTGASVAARQAETQSRRLLLGERLTSPRLAQAQAQLTGVAQESGLLESSNGRHTVLTAMAFLAALPHRVPLPELAVDPDGEVSFDWQDDDNILSISLGMSGRLTVAWDINDKKGSSTDRFVGAIPRSLLSSISAFA